jgi:prophage regulatory protein
MTFSSEDSHVKNNSPRIMRLPAVLSLTGLSRSTVYGLISRAEFPKQVKLSCRACGWYTDEVEAWLAERGNRRTAV